MGPSWDDDMDGEEELIDMYDVEMGLFLMPFAV
jgi:hypothetical protein